MKKIIVAPSILSANFASLQEDINKVNQAGADWLHIDVMDGHFVPNITIGPCVVKSLRKCSKLFFDVHLMIKEPQKYWKEFKNAGADLITFHSEITADKIKLAKEIKESKIKVGVSIKPKTQISEILELLKFVDLVLIMTVEPGFGGQKFMDDMLVKIKELRKIIDENKYDCLIEVDGGINNITAKKCVEAGADALVSGSYIFSSKNIKEAITSLR